MECGISPVVAKISIHVLREEDDLQAARATVPHTISIHVLREEDDYWS